MLCLALAVDLSITLTSALTLVLATASASQLCISLNAMVSARVWVMVGSYSQEMDTIGV